MPSLTNRLKLSLPNGNEYVNRAALNKIFEDIDRLVMLQGDFDTAKKEIDDNLAKKISKSGDTMTGNLTLDGSTGERALAFKVGAGASDLIAMRNVLATNTFSLRDYRTGVDIWSWKDNVFNLNVTNTNLLKKTDIYSKWMHPSGTSIFMADGTDLNSLRESGLYCGGKFVNAPNASQGYFYVEVVQHNEAVNTMQIATGVVRTGVDAGIWIRRRSASTWGAWEQIIDSKGGTLTGHMHIELAGSNDKRFAFTQDGNLTAGITGNQTGLRMFDWKNSKTVFDWNGTTFDVPVNTNLLKKTEDYTKWLLPTGTTNQLSSGADLNTLVDSGLYGGTGLLNSPEGLTAYHFFVEVIKYNDTNYVLQRATTLAGNMTVLNNVGTWVRRKSGSGWGAWEKVIDSKGGTLTGFLEFDVSNGEKIIRGKNGGAGKSGLAFTDTGTSLYDWEKGRLVWYYDKNQDFFGVATNTNLLKKTGDTMQGHLIFLNNKNLSFRNNAGVEKAAIALDGDDNFFAWNNIANKYLWKVDNKTGRFEVLADNLVSKDGDNLTGDFAYYNPNPMQFRPQDKKWWLINTNQEGLKFIPSGTTNKDDWQWAKAIWINPEGEVNTQGVKVKGERVLTTSDLKEKIPSRSGKDDNGIYTIYEETEKDGKLSKRSVLSNPDTDGNYLVRTVTYYLGGVANETEIFDLKYDEDGDFVKAVPR